MSLYMNTSNNLRNFLEIPYDVLEEMNLRAFKKSLTIDASTLEAEYREYLTKEKRIKAVTLCFTDIEGRLHTLDYDKKYLLKNASNLTFDGSSVRGLSSLHESDLRLGIDWASIRWLPSDIFGPGKVIMFAYILNRDRTLYSSDFRGRLMESERMLKKEKGLRICASAEIEGFLVQGVSAEQNYTDDSGFSLVSTGGYYHSLPLDTLRTFIDRSAEAQRAMGFVNEKDHPEVAPSQFELNFSYTHAVRASDNVQLYKLVCRQIAHHMGLTATFLPKPLPHINGSGMHINFSVAKDIKNLFYEKKGNEGLSSLAWDIIHTILAHAQELCLLFNSSVNAYRRLDPHFEAPNQIKVSSVDRSSMIRIPVGDERSMRCEIRSVGPDSNPYLVLFSLASIASDTSSVKKIITKKEWGLLPSTLYDALEKYEKSDFITKMLGVDDKKKYAYYKRLVADRSAKDLGKRVKTSEVIYHHEVTNQLLWNRF